MRNLNKRYKLVERERRFKRAYEHIVQLNNSSDAIQNRRNVQNVVQNSPDSSDNPTIIVTNKSSVNNSTDEHIPTNDDSNRVLEESVISANINSASNSAPRINLDINTPTSAHMQEAASAQVNMLLINTIELCQQTLKQFNSRQSMLQETIPNPNGRTGHCQQTVSPKLAKTTRTECQYTQLNRFVCRLHPSATQI
ncbi:unnamed protein product [Mytilus edulis]|uniref:Uncharacterized protein n=1 Tax=Mytilus edulis TaxID=6550 RepID=A0A8S3RPB5_MYTED|nr:unnamed protein product [Mytilus edulis]